MQKSFEDKVRNEVHAKALDDMRRGADALELLRDATGYATTVTPHDFRDTADFLERKLRDSDDQVVSLAQFLYAMVCRDNELVGEWKRVAPATRRRFIDVAWDTLNLLRG